MMVKWPFPLYLQIETLFKKFALHYFQHLATINISKSPTIVCTIVNNLCNKEAGILIDSD